jgi:thiol-disulfide isomerase/thioredoxin
MSQARVRHSWVSVGALSLALAAAFLQPRATAAQQGPNPTPSADAPKSSASDSSKPAVLSTSAYATAPAASAFVSGDASAQPSQPTSLGEIARLARAKKQAAAVSSGPRATMLIDDDNMTHGGDGISVVGGESSAPSDGSARPFSGSHSGKLTLLDFWATWCGPCRESLPDLKQFQATYGRDQIEVISVSADKNEGAWKSFVQQNGMNWEQRIDTDGQMRRQYGVTALPTYVLTDSSGHVIQRLVGEDPEVPLANRLAPGLASLVK